MQLRRRRRAKAARRARARRDGFERSSKAFIRAQPMTAALRSLALTSTSFALTGPLFFFGLVVIAARAYASEATAARTVSASDTA